LEIANVDLSGGETAQIYPVQHYGRATNTIDNVNGSGTLSVVPLNATQSDVLTFNGTIASGAKVALNQWNGGDSGNLNWGVATTLGSNFVLNGTLEVNRDNVTTDSFVVAGALNATGLQMNSGAKIGGTGSIFEADVVMNGNNTLYSSGTLTLVNAWSGSGGTGGHVIVNGTGNSIAAGSTIALTGTWNNGTTINPGAQLLVGTGATLGGKLTLSGNTTSGGGKLVYQTGNLPAVQAALLAGTISTTGTGEAVGYLTGAQYLALHGNGNGFLAGYTVASPDVLLKQTYAGDCFLNGTVTASDFAQMDASYLLGTTNATWMQGDFNYDGVVNYQDYALADAGYYAYATTNGGLPLADARVALDTARFGAAFTSAYEAALAAPVAVPEPASLALLGLGAVALLSRRRH
jgi:hypothetical protein